MNDKIKIAHYKQCFITDAKGEDISKITNLEELLKKAAKSVKAPWERSMGRSAGSQLLTGLSEKSGCYCGELVYFEKDRKIALVDIEGDKIWQATTAPVDQEGKKRNWQETALYFAVLENHVAVIQSSQLAIDDLLDFFSWMIQEKAGELPKGLIALANLPTKTALQKLKNKPVKGIKIGDKLFSKVIVDEGTTTQTESGKAPAEGGKRKRREFKIEPNNMLMQVLRDLSVDQPILDELEQSKDPASIRVDILINYRSRSEKDGRNLLNAMVSTFGDQDKLDARIMLEGNSEIRGEELSIRGKVNVQCPDGHIAREDALSKLAQWLRTELKSGEI